MDGVRGDLEVLDQVGHEALEADKVGVGDAVRAVNQEHDVGRVVTLDVWEIKYLHINILEVSNMNSLHKQLLCFYLVLFDHGLYVIYNWKQSSAYTQIGVNGVALFISIDELLQ